MLPRALYAAGIRSTVLARPVRLSARAFPFVVGLTALPALAQERSFDFSGTQRSRYESLDEQFLPRLDERDDVLALQTSLRFEARMPRLTFVGELLDSRAELNDAGSFVNNTVVNSLEPLQAYVSWASCSTEPQDAKQSLRVGRMTLDLGKRRVMSRNRFRNTVNNFAGADWQRRTAEGGNLRAFYLVPMRHLPTDRESLLDNEFELDRAARDTAVFGFFYQLPQLKAGNFLEVYGLDYEASTADPASAADLFSIGARGFRPPEAGRWHYEIETIVQGGESSAGVGGVASPDLPHDAFFAHFEVGYAIDGPWATTVTFQYDRASGDRDPLDQRNDRFNTLFGDRRFDFGPTGIFGPFNRSNLETPGLRVTIAPSPRWQGMLSYRSMRLASSTDTWVGTELRDASGAAGSSLATQLEASANWAVIPERLSIDVGFAVLKLGRFARQTLAPAQHDEPRYWYATITTTF
jgi:hypothetical protein